MADHGQGSGALGVDLRYQNRRHCFRKYRSREKNTGERNERRKSWAFFSFFFLFFLYHILVVKVQEIAWSTSYDENKTENPKQTNKGKFYRQSSS